MFSPSPDLGEGVFYASDLVHRGQPHIRYIRPSLCRVQGGTGTVRFPAGSYQTPGHRPGDAGPHGPGRGPVDLPA